MDVDQRPAKSIGWESRKIYPRSKMHWHSIRCEGRPRQRSSAGTSTCGVGRHVVPGQEPKSLSIFPALPFFLRLSITAQIFFWKNMSASAAMRVGHARAPLVMFHNIPVDDNEVAEAAVFF